MLVRAEDEWENHQVRNAAMVALGRCKTSDVTLDISQLKQRLADPDVDTRKATALSVGQAGISELIPELVQIMEGKTEVRERMSVERQRRDLGNWLMKQRPTRLSL